MSAKTGSSIISYRCPHCGSNLSIPKEFAGQAGQCKKCGSAITVPDARVEEPATKRTSHESQSIQRLGYVFWLIVLICPLAGVLCAAFMSNSHPQRKLCFIISGVWLAFFLLSFNGEALGQVVGMLVAPICLVSLFGFVKPARFQRIVPVHWTRLTGGSVFFASLFLVGILNEPTRNSNPDESASTSVSTSRTQLASEEAPKNGNETNTDRQPKSLKNLQNGRVEVTEPRPKATEPVSPEPQYSGKPLEVPENVSAAIRQEVASRYPTNYSMQKILIEAEIQAYLALQNYSAPNVPQAVLGGIYQKTASRYPVNYSMQKTLIDAQVQDYLALQNYSAPNVPQAVLAGIYREIAGRYPTDYSMQKTLIDAQVKDYFALQGRQQSQVLNRPNASSQSTRYQGTATAQSIGSAPQQILNGIRTKAQQKWPGDYEMQEYTIKNQASAFRRLQAGNVYDVPANVYNQIATAGQKQWPSDYEMQEYTTKNQADAYKRLRAGNVYGVPANVYNQIAAAAQEQWPRDYEMQEYTIKNQASSYGRLR